VNAHISTPKSPWGALPVHPGVALRLLNESVSEPGNEVLLRKTIAHDPALLLAVFRQSCASQFAGLDVAATYRGIVNQLTVPVCRFAAVRAIVGCTSDERAIEGHSPRWRRACIRSSIARALAASTQRVDPDVLAIGALLFDAGGFLETDHWQPRTIESLEQCGAPEAIVRMIRGAFDPNDDGLELEAHVLVVADAASRLASDGETELPMPEAIAPELESHRWNRIVRDAIEDADRELEFPRVPLGEIRERAIGLMAEMSIDAYADVHRLRTRTRELARQVSTDALTGVYSRLAFNQRFEEEMERARRDGLPITLMLLDLDDFKHINDTYGHPGGDAYLTGVAGVLQACARRIDVVARYGGEEFAVILPHTNILGANAIADRLRRSIESLVIEYDGHEIRSTASVGSCTVHNVDRERIFPSHLLELTDRQLYIAKRSGKNRCEMEQVDEQIAQAG